MGGGGVELPFLGDPFVIEGLLASGPRAQIWKARQHPEWGRLVCACCEGLGNSQGAAVPLPHDFSQTFSGSYFL